MIGAFILSTGQSTERDAVRSVESQLDPGETVIIDNQSPVNRAVNMCLEAAERYGWDYFLIMGADTIHDKGSVKAMMDLMTDDLWCVMGMLRDYYRGDDSYGNHLYNAKHLKGYRVDEKDPMYDHKIHHDMDEKGLKKVLTKKTIGVHHPIWTPEEAFKKFYHAGSRYTDLQATGVVADVVARLNENHCDVNEAALDGWEMGVEVYAGVLTKDRADGVWQKVKDNYNNNETLEW